jgi:selenocysteine lyase/cysteine desulfurase
MPAGLRVAGAMPIDVRHLEADFLVAAGYKWLLSPYGTGFLWVRAEVIETIPVGAFYWLALENAERLQMLSNVQVRVARGARRWDSPETASFLNLSAMAASLEFLLRAGADTVREHNRKLITGMIERLLTPRLHERLKEAGVIVSLREGSLRIAPHLFNSERDIDRLLTLLAQ